MRLVSVSAALALTATGFAMKPPSDSAGLVSLAVVNARIWTGDSRRPWADALAVAGETIAVVGTSAEVQKLANAPARVIDAHGAMLVPAACIDSVNAEKGKLARGMRADFVILHRDITGAPPGSVRDADVSMRVEAGRPVFEAEANPE